MTVSIDVNLLKGDRPLHARLATALDQMRKRLPKAIAAVMAMKDQGLPHLNLPFQRGDIPDIERLSDNIADHADHLVVFGIGGSSLGAQALAQLVGWGTEAYAPAAGRPHLHMMENLDGSSLVGLLKRLNLKKTKFLAISKSGSTTEPLTQALMAIETLEHSGFGSRLPECFAIIAEPADNALRKLGQTIGCPIYAHDPALGGRYSVFSLVGLAPARAIGLDITSIRAGAAQTLDRLGDPNAPHAQGAAFAAAAAEIGLGGHVLWAYADRLERLVMWWRQLWGESLGKQGKGTTPIRALGPVDQHSQLQLYLDGPNDKAFTILTAAAPEQQRVPAQWADRIGQPLLGGKTPGEIVAAQARASAETLAQNGRIVRTIHLPRLDEAAMGGLLMHYIVETLITAQLLGVDPFDQPAVELGKVLTRKYLGEGA